MLSTILGIIFFAIATMFIYAWGYVKDQRVPNNLSMKLTKKAEKRIIVALKRNEAMTFKELSNILKGLKVSYLGTRRQLTIQEPKEFTKGLLKHMVDKSVVEIDYKNNPKRYYLKNKTT